MRAPYRFDHRVSAARAFGQLAHRRHRILGRGHIECRGRAQPLGDIHLALAFADGNDPHLALRQNTDELQPNRAAADHHCGIALLDSGFVNSAQHASQRFGHRRVRIGYAVGNFQHVLPHDSPRNPDVFRVRSVIEQQILAKIWLAFFAVKTNIARRGIRRKNAHAFAHAAVHPAAGFFNHSRELVAEQRRRLDHSRVITALPHFQVRAAGQRHFHPHQYLIFFDLGNIDGFDLQIFHAIQDGGRHVPISFFISAHA